MNFNEELKKILNKPENKEMAEHLNSWQFKLSQQILALRIKNKLNKEQASKKCNLSLQEYNKLENGIDLKSSKEKYLKVINVLKGMLK